METDRELIERLTIETNKLPDSERSGSKDLNLLFELTGQHIYHNPSYHSWKQGTNMAPIVAVADMVAVFTNMPDIEDSTVNERIFHAFKDCCKWTIENKCALMSTACEFDDGFLAEWRKLCLYESTRKRSMTLYELMVFLTKDCAERVLLRRNIRMDEIVRKYNNGYG